MEETRPSLRQDFAWILKELLKVFSNPIGVAGGMIDACRGWHFSRNWFFFWLHLPAAVLVLATYVVFAFAFFSRKDTQIQSFSVLSEKNCSTQSLLATYDQQTDAEFCAAAHLSTPIDAAPGLGVITDLTKRYIELLCKRILVIEPNNQFARYRLGLVSALMGREDDALEAMRELAEGKYGDFPQANAWIARHMLLLKHRGQDVSLEDLITQFKKASTWKDIDPRLMSVYAQLLVQTGDKQQAVEIAKQVAAVRSDGNLELARLYRAIGNEDGLRDACYQVDEYFSKHLNTPLEKDSDRLAVAEARKLMDRLDAAVDVLTEGIRVNPNRPELVRELSEIQRLIYLKSIRQTPDGGFRADLTLLEKFAETDPTNPNISSEISKLLPMKMRPTRKLMDHLKGQIEKGVTTGEAHLRLAEGYYGVGNAKEAIRHWELALNKMPDNVQALNNLALSLAKASTNNVNRSLELLDRAQTISPGNPELLDSLGEILMIANRPKDAINKLELAIRNGNNRIETRKKLVSAYKAIGMDDMADAQLKVIATMVEAQAQASSNDGTATGSN